MYEHDHSRPRFETSEGLRELLNRLQAAGSGAWRRDREAAALMEHATGRYAQLARKHGLDPWEATAAAFDAMRTRAVRCADDPWAVVTRAVQVTMIAENRANGLLCSPQQARRPQYSVFHDVERFSDRENPLTDYHPAFQITPNTNTITDANHPDTTTKTISSPPDDDESDDYGSLGVVTAVEDTIALFTALGWSPVTARGAIEYVCSRLADTTSRTSALESLRRDKHARALLDVPSTSWNALLRVLLGHPDPDRARTQGGRGVLLRLLVGEPLRALFADDDLVLTIGLSAPGLGGERRG